MFDAARPERGPLARYGGHAAHSFYVKVAFSPDGTHVASGSCDKRVYIWQADRPQDGPYALDGHNGEVTGVDWSAGDFGRLASCADDGSLRIWSIAHERARGCGRRF
jgi:denticleless